MTGYTAYGDSLYGDFEIEFKLCGLIGQRSRCSMRISPRRRRGISSRSFFQRPRRPRGRRLCERAGTIGSGGRDFSKSSNSHRWAHPTVSPIHGSCKRRGPIGPQSLERTSLIFQGGSFRSIAPEKTRGTWPVGGMLSANLSVATFLVQVSGAGTWNTKVFAPKAD